MEMFVHLDLRQDWRRITGGFFKEEFQFGFSLQDENQTLQHCNCISVSPGNFRWDLDSFYFVCFLFLPFPWSWRIFGKYHLVLLSRHLFIAGTVWWPTFFQMSPKCGRQAAPILPFSQETVRFSPISTGVGTKCQMQSCFGVKFPMRVDPATSNFKSNSPIRILSCF